MSRRIGWSVLAVLSIWACSGDDSSTPPTTETVVSVDVTPSATHLNPTATIQLTATPRDAQGAVVTGTKITWTTSASGVARVSSSGLVTAVAVGTATISATAGGIRGEAFIYVEPETAESDYGPVIATADIGPGGGTVGTTDIGVTIPGGAWAGTRTVQLIRDTVSQNTFTGNSASEQYFIDGLAPGVTVQARVRIKTNGQNQGAGAIALMRPSIQMGENITSVMGVTVIPAIDSSGYLVATVPVAGRTTWAGGPRATRRGMTYGAGGTGAFEIDAPQLKADAELTGLISLTHVAGGGGTFDVWGFGGGADVAPKVQKTATMVQEAYNTLVAMGYDLTFRAADPIQVYLVSMPANEYGLFSLVLPWPLDIDLGYISYNRNFTENAEYAGTVIHEMFHLVKSAYFARDTWANWLEPRWLDEATSTWIQERHPQTAQPYANAIALSWRDSLFTGLSSGMVANSGYGKAPIIKFVAARWGDATVKNMLTLVKGGMTTTSAFLAALPEPPSVWWPEFLKQLTTGAIYPWTSAELMPTRKYDVTLEMGREPAWLGDAMFALGVEADRLIRDTARFGPNFKLPVAIDPRDAGLGKIVVFNKPAGSARYQWMAGGDTVLIPGTMLQSRDSILLLLSPVKPVAPYAATTALRFITDLQVPESDWYFPTVTGLTSGIAFTCSAPGDSVTMDVPGNAVAVWALLAANGTWKFSSQGTRKSQTHTWAPTPAFADTIRKYNLTLSSDLVTGTAGDTMKFSARLQFHATTDPLGRGAGRDAGGINPWWLLVPAGALPLAFRRRTRWLGASLAGSTLLVLGACELGQISFDFDETFTYTFTKIRFTADAAQPNAPLMQLTQGSGKSVLNSFRSEYWTYITNSSGVKTDSTRSTCTGSGTATYTVAGTGYKDGVTPPAAADFAETVARIVGRDAGTIRKYLKAK